MEMTIGSYRIVIERIPFTPIELRQRYDQLASEWHRVVEKLGFAHAYRQMLQQIAEDDYFSQLPTETAVLDCGIGAGDLSLALMDSWGRPLRLDGVDISAKMLAQAEQRLHKLGNTAHLQQADMQQLPYASNQFDIVMSAHALEHLATPEAGLREMIRVVKPGGLVLVIVTNRSLWGRWIQHRWRVQLLDEADLARWMRSFDVHQLAVYPVSMWRLKGSMAMIGRVG